MDSKTDALIIGGGLAGLASALHLAKNGVQVLVVEKKIYPFHRVCGEYISNEVLPYLKYLGIEIDRLAPSRISRFLLSSPSGNSIETALDMGGFGISRYMLDNYLYELGKKNGVEFRLATSANSVSFADNQFTVTLSSGEIIQSDVVIGAFGKRANLDRLFKRPFFSASSPYIGVKYHLKTNLPKDTIALHNFKDGYAGISAIESDKYCFCYLTTRQNLKQSGSIPEMENKFLKQNPFLHKILSEAEFLFEKPEVINEISFASKSCIENHILCIGDAAGMIAPLCGNGMAMAFHSAKILSEAVTAYFRTGKNRHRIESAYAAEWKQLFNRRLQAGRIIQGLFGRKIVTETVIAVLKKVAANNAVYNETNPRKPVLKQNGF